MLIQMTVQDFLKELASSSPAPGGGSVSALNGSLAAGLVSMVCNLSADRKDLAESRETILKIRERALVLKDELADLIDKDTEAFNQVMAAFKMPKEDDDQKAARSKAIQAAFRLAVEAPLSVADRCAEIVDLARTVSQGFNPNTASDLGVAAQCARAGMAGALMNVDINLPSIKDKDYVAAAEQKKAGYLEATETKIMEIAEAVTQAIG